MARIQSFGNFAYLRETLTQSPVAISPQADPNMTGVYIPGDGVSGQTIGGVSPAVVKAAVDLKDIHDRLRDIFSGVRSRMDAFRFGKMRSAFERELAQGVDSVGRAHAILLPSARGIEKSDI